MANAMPASLRENMILTLILYSLKIIYIFDFEEKYENLERRNDSLQKIENLKISVCPIDKTILKGLHHSKKCINWLINAVALFFTISRFTIYPNANSNAPPIILARFPSTIF